METNAGSYVSEALPIVESIHSKDKNCIMAGGTNFYVEAFLKGLSPVPQIETEKRKEIDAELDNFDTKELYSRLLKTDPEWAGLISSPNDRQRIKRGLEVYILTGKTLSEWNRKKREKKYKGQFFAFSIDMERDRLYRNINERSKLMVKNGLVEEVRNINEKGFNSANCKAMGSIGYKETEMYLKEEIKSVDELIDTIALNTRHLAKRQMTWLRNRNYVRHIKRENVFKQTEEYFSKIDCSKF